MTAAEHYAQAERVLKHYDKLLAAVRAGGKENLPDVYKILLARAQVHATLATVR